MLLLRWCCSDSRFVCECVAPALQVTSSYTAPCVLSLVSQDADIVLIEFTFNDSQRGNHKLEDPTTCVQSFRIVTRYLLRPCSSDRQRARL